MLELLHEKYFLAEAILILSPGQFARLGMQLVPDTRLHEFYPHYLDGIVGSPKFALRAITSHFSMPKVIWHKFYGPSVILCIDFSTHSFQGVPTDTIPLLLWQPSAIFPLSILHGLKTIYLKLLFYSVVSNYWTACELGLIKKTGTVVVKGLWTDWKKLEFLNGVSGIHRSPYWLVGAWYCGLQVRLSEAQVYGGFCRSFAYRGGYYKCSCSVAVLYGAVGCFPR